MKDINLKKTLKISTISSIVAISLILINACLSRCSCAKNTSCAIITVKSVQKDSLLVSKTICMALTDTLSYRILQDSVDKIKMQFQSNNVIVAVRDSFSSTDAKTVQPSEFTQFEKQGFTCGCTK